MTHSISLTALSFGKIIAFAMNEKIIAQCWSSQSKNAYRQISNIRGTEYQNSNVSLSCLAVVYTQSIEAMCWVKNEDAVGAAPTGDAPTASEWSASLLPTKVCLVLQVWKYMLIDREDVVHIQMNM